MGESKYTACLLHMTTYTVYCLGDIRLNSLFKPSIGTCMSVWPLEYWYFRTPYWHYTQGFPPSASSLTVTVLMCSHVFPIKPNRVYHLDGKHYYTVIIHTVSVAVAIGSPGTQAMAVHVVIPFIPHRLWRRERASTSIHN